MNQRHIYPQMAADGRRKVRMFSFKKNKTSVWFFSA